MSNGVQTAFEGGFISLTAIGNVLMWNITSVSPEPTDYLWVGLEKLRIILSDIAASTDDIGKVKLFPIREASEASKDGSKPAQGKIMARLFHVADKDGKPTGQVVWYSVRGPKGVINLKGVPEEQLHKLKVQFSLDTLKGGPGKTFLDSIDMYSAIGKEMDKRRSYVYSPSRNKMSLDDGEII